MKQLSECERRLAGGIDQQAMLGQTEAWCAINSGTGNASGLAKHGLLVDPLRQSPFAIGKLFHSKPA